MKLNTFLAITVFLSLSSISVYGQTDVPQYVYLLTKAEAASNGQQIGCTCYSNVTVEWRQASTTMVGLPPNQRAAKQPWVKPQQTEVYDLYTITSGVAQLKERHTVVVLDLRMWIKESNVTNVMEKRKITFVGQLINVGSVNIVKEWVLNTRTPAPPNPISITDDYELMDASNRVEKEVITKNDKSNANLVDTWNFRYFVTVKGRNCTQNYERKISAAVPQVVNVYKLMITRFSD